MGDTVVKLAQPGYDAKSAGDENLVYNSNWPLLKIVKSGSFTTSDKATPNQVVIDHNLGYVPAFWYFANTTAEVWDTEVGVVTERSEFLGALDGNFSPVITEKSLVFDINPGFLTGTVKFEYYIFALDITKPYTAPITKTGGSGGGDSTTKFKLAKDGKDISSKRMEDYVIHSDARSPLIHAVYPGKIVADPTITPDGRGFTYYHNLGYIPMFFAFMKNGLSAGTNSPTPNSWVPLYAAGSGSPFNIDEQKIVVHRFLTDEQISLVILKDPFQVDYSVTVTI